MAAQGFTTGRLALGPGGGLLSDTLPASRLLLTTPLSIFGLLLLLLAGRGLPYGLPKLFGSWSAHPSLAPAPACPQPRL